MITIHPLLRDLNNENIDINININRSQDNVDSCYHLCTC